MGSIANDDTSNLSPVTGIERLKAIQEIVEARVATSTTDLRQVIKHIYDNPEIAFEEYIAHDTICKFLEDQGFQVTRKAYALDTAFEVLYGQGGRLISINAEYDALPGIGHGCGHHLIAAASIAAFLGITAAIKKNNIEGRVQLLGCPAEENQGGKAVLCKNGALKGVDAAVMAHPVPPYQISKNAIEDNVTAVGGCSSLAMLRWVVEFHGRASHAAACPHLGVNAFDAAVAAYNNVALLRQQIMDAERIHGCVLEGPTVPNTIGHYTKTVWIARSPTRGSLEALCKRVLACFEAAALATGCTVKITEGNMYTDTLVTESLCNRYAEITNSIQGHNTIPFIHRVEPGSTDFGNVTYECPGIHAYYGVPCTSGVSVHHQTFTEATGTEESFYRSLKQGTMLALTAWDLLTDDAFYKQVKAEWDVTVKKHSE
ncbi:hypothetical protein N7520_007452 [Penicillium odoratum]|uniref:uncharacterized protein n=1 Tax=Penicillium odoratum TaxID=1167516 RepID=UPI002548C6C2|nr:uncharacterized protein N7520_007452 [Penicillium odoratum]KAJ5760296.1 hypothetical protein N7520_007452 [Penicillium odoratum]